MWKKIKNFKIKTKTKLNGLISVVKTAFKNISRKCDATTQVSVKCCENTLLKLNRCIMADVLLHEV